MHQIKKLTIFMLVFLTSASLILAQDNPDFSYKIGGTIQAWTSLGQINNSDTNSLGWGLRRVRLRAYTTLGDKMKGFVQVELTSPKLLDARIEYLVSDMFTIRAGRFIGAGVRSAGLTSHSDIDITERPLTAQKWGIATIGSDFRDYGMDVVGSFGDVKATLTLHNGDGAANILNKISGHSAQNGSFAVSGMLTFKPKTVKGLEAGAYYGMGNKEINEYKSYNAYAYYEPGPFRVKAELIGWTNTFGSTDLNQMGYYLFGGYKLIDCVEAVARYENYDPNTDLDKNEQSLLTIGATYSVYPSKWTTGKITAAYTIISETGNAVDNNVFQIVMQLVF
jgi:predicted porin